MLRRALSKHNKAFCKSLGRLEYLETVNMRDFCRASWSAEEALRLEAAILASTRDAVIITDLASKILAVNPAFTEITGYGEAEVLGENPRFLRSGRHDRAFYQAMWASLLTTGYWQGEIWNRRKSGEIYPELLTLNAVCNAQGDPVHYLGVATDLSQLRRHEERLQRLVHYDPLTGLPNRLLLEARLQHTLERAGREGTRAAVLVIDLDQFKTINDSHGHAAGDALLVAVTRRLRTRLREEDTLSRLAGDQFVLVLEALHEYQEAEIMARGIQALLETPFILPDDCKAYVRASVGISVYPQDGDTAQTLLVGADAAVHRAKELGGRRFCYYTSELNVQARTTLVMEEALRRALAQEEFVLYYQPKVDLRSGRIAGAEALIRWQRPGFGLASPLEFIPAAEKNGLIEAIGAWVIRDACRQMGAWREAGLAGIKVAVNVSARQFRRGGLEEEVAEALARYGVEPSLLMLELTESMLMAEPEEAVARMTALKRIGVRLSLDDFGTGYSSLAYLSRFPIDQMKIDRSFVNDIITDPGAATIATSVIALAHRMRLGVVAEGVETEAQAGYLRQNGCDEMQGYLFSRPVPAEEFADLVRQGRKLPTPAAAGQARTLLIVDDELPVLNALQRMLVDEGYMILTAASAREGLELLAEHPAQVILSDQRMPGMSGTEFLGRVKVLYPDTVRMVLTGYAELETVVQAVNEGAIYKFFSKPWDVEQLRAQIRDAFLYYEGVIRPRRGAAPGP
jgi:diguanylate cyclase (GGDEF)-like protein/PAS domain S-box-containing protein